MPIIINDFEVVTPPSTTPDEQNSTRRPVENQEHVPPPPRPEDLDLLMRRFVQRRLRLWAD